MIDIKGLDKASVIAVLYNRARPQGMGFMNYDSKPMTKKEADAIYWECYGRKDFYFDYLQGRVMKVDLSGDQFNEWGFDRDNGKGAAAEAVEVLRQDKEPDAPEILSAHEKSKAEAAMEARELMGEKTTTTDGEGVSVIHMGLEDMKDILGPKVDAAMKKDDPK